MPTLSLSAGFADDGAGSEAGTPEGTGTPDPVVASLTCPARPAARRAAAARSS